MPLNHEKDLDRINILDGHIYDDDWVSPSLTIGPATLGKKKTLELTFWNPDFTSVHMLNTMTATIGARTVTHNNIGHGEIVTIKATFANLDEALELNISSYLDEAEHDPRQRAMKLVSVKWPT